LLTSKRIESINQHAEQGNQIILLAQEIEKLKQEAGPALSEENISKLNEAIHAGVHPKRHRSGNPETLKKAIISLGSLKPLGDKLRSYLYERNAYCRSYNELLGKDSPIQKMLSDPYYTALTKPPEARISQEEKSHLAHYALLIMLIACAPLGLLNKF
jgi:hypothetical protein